MHEYAPSAQDLTSYAAKTEWEFSVELSANAHLKVPADEEFACHVYVVLL